MFIKYQGKHFLLPNQYLMSSWWKFVNEGIFWLKPWSILTYHINCNKERKHWVIQQTHQNLSQIQVEKDWSIILHRRLVTFLSLCTRKCWHFFLTSNPSPWSKQAAFRPKGLQIKFSKRSVMRMIIMSWRALFECKPFLIFKMTMNVILNKDLSVTRWE